MNERTCAVDGCEKPAQKLRTICRTHRDRWEKHRSYDDPKPTPVERFTKSYAVDDNGCWIWLLTRNENGYGQFSENRVMQYAHRWAYVHFVGEIPNGLQLDHLCRVRRCVNPAHLEPVTPLVNNRRGESPWSKNARKTHCVRGHAFTAENTKLSPQGWRNCIACVRIRNAERYGKTAA